MNTLLLIAVILALCVLFHRFGTSRSKAVVSGNVQDLHSLPGYHGTYVALWCGVPALLLILLWIIFEPAIIEALVVSQMETLGMLTNADGTALEQSRINLLLTDVYNTAAGRFPSDDELIVQVASYTAGLRGSMFWAMTVLALALGGMGAFWGFKKIAPRLRARNQVEQAFKVGMIVCSTIAILTTVGIVLSLLFESYRFFTMVPFTDFLFGLHWSPQIALRPDQVGSSGAFGAIPLLAGTMFIAFIALTVAVPLGLLSAIYMAEYAPAKVRAWVKPILEILAGIPTVVYGFFAALTVAPLIRGFGESIGLTVASESALAAGVVMGVMIIPFVSSLSDDVITAVPQAMREGSYGLGATKSETIKRVVLPAALPGIVGGILLAASRAIGETMIVVMAAGLAANLTLNPFEAVTTVTVQIVKLLTGDQEFDSPKTLAAFALGLMLFCITLCLNVIALHVVRKYREQYD
ncbi:MAG: phosphate ABC transporter permease subunit PstC [Rhodospirillaceae bacterium]